MRRTLIVFLLLMPVAASAQQPAGPSAEPVVVASGQGVVLAVPDRAWITISAESRAPSPREAQRLNAEAMRPVQDKLKSAGIPAEGIRTIAYDVQYEWDFVNNKRVGRGYVARNTIEVRIDAVERVGEYSGDRRRFRGHLARGYSIRLEGSGQARTGGIEAGGGRRPRQG